MQRSWRVGPLAALCLCLVLFCARSAPAQSLDWTPLLERLVADGFDRARMQELFAGVSYTPDPMGHKMHSLYVTKYGSGLVRDIQQQLETLGYDPGKPDGVMGNRTRAAIRGFQREHGQEQTGRADEALLSFIRSEGRPAPPGYRAPSLPASEAPPVYRSIMTEERLAEAVAFYRVNQKILQDIFTQYHILPEVTVGLLTVETRLGTFLGEENAFRTLASMARATSPEDFAGWFTRERPQGEAMDWLRRRTREKANWAYDEFKALLRYAANKGADPRSLPGSVYGAIGISQFMPTNALKFGVDGDGDGVVNLFVLEDALHSMGNFLSRHGWRKAGASLAEQRKALFRYNPSSIYVNTILAVAEHVRKAGK